MEELLGKHRKEKKDLQAKITQKKKAATKKTRKGVNEECDRLETELKEKHAAELVEISDDTISTSETHEPNDEALDETLIDTSTTAVIDDLDNKVSRISDTEEDGNRIKKPNRQKARMARKAAEQARIAEQAEQEAANLPDRRAMEQETMSKTFEKHKLKEKEIRADGHCLYSAIADQVRSQGNQLAISGVETQKDDYRTVRYVAADYMSSHSDDFIPFLEEDLESYLHKVRDTGEWGGQIELLALSKAYDIKISVVQGDGMVTDIGESQDDSKRAWLAYYRHGFGLGEHYNSLRTQELKQ